MQRKLAHVMTALAATSLAGCVSVNGNLSSSSAANEDTDDGDTACESAACTSGPTGGAPTTDDASTTGDASTTDGGPSGGTSSGTSAGTGSTDDGDPGSSSTGTTTGAEADLEGWTMRRSIVIENHMPEDLVDFQVEVLVPYDDDMQVEFDDLRFTEADGTSLLPYWRERFLPTVEAEAWVRVPFIPASGTVELWMYYGNPEAEDGSDGEATMFFIDDFTASPLDPIKWGATSPDHAVVAGRLEVSTGAVYSNDAIVEVGQILQARVQWPCCEDAPYIPTLTTALGQSDALFGDFLRFLTPYLQIQGSADMDIFPDMLTTMNGGGNTWHDVGLAREFGLAHFRRFPGPTTYSYVEVMPGAHYVIMGEEQGATATNMGMGDFWVDHVFVRGFTLIDPTASVGDEESVP